MKRALVNVADAHIGALRDRRRAVEQLCDLAQHLAPADRALVLQVLQHGQSMTDIARLRNESARCTQRRMRSLLHCMRLPEFNLLATRGKTLPDDMRHVASLVICRGHTMREAATMANLSLHHVREHVQTVRTLAILP